MIKKIIKAFKDPKYAFYYLYNKHIKFLLHETFISNKELKSETENYPRYLFEVKSAVENQKSFDNFRNKYGYKEVLENVTYKQGYEYLKILKERNDNIFEKGLSTILVNDNIGNPIKYTYKGMQSALSPQTLRYLKVTSDLFGLFGKNFKKVVEIGCGYGGQQLINDQLLNIDSLILFDLPIVNKLISKYLNAHLLNGTFKTSTINEIEPNNYDLVVSNYAFSELPEKLQLKYIEKVVSNSDRGYLTMNSGLNCQFSTKGKLPIKRLYEYLPEFEIFEEEPLTSPNNYIIVWGHDKNNVNNILKKKILTHNI
jgi:putative sugar O-methyltransferase